VREETYNCCMYALTSCVEMSSTQSRRSAMPGAKSCCSCHTSTKVRGETIYFLSTLQFTETINNPKPSKNN
jgi:hypothetical protein